MTPEHMMRLADAEREFEHTCAQGWVLRCRLPTRIEMRSALRATEGNLDAAVERLVIGSVIGWANVKAVDIGVPEGMAGFDASASLGFSAPLVQALLADRLDALDALQADFVARMNVRDDKLKADEKNSASV